MNAILSFNEINQKHRQYQVQGLLISKPNFFTSKTELAILWFIIEDFDKNKIECIAFGEAASKLFKTGLKIDSIYLITNAKAIVNNKYVKTKHSFKLQLTEKTKMTRLKTREYVINNKIYVSTIEKNSKKKKVTKSLKNNQMSIKNWLKKKSFNSY